MLALYQECQRLRGQDFLDQIAVAAVPHMDKAGQKKVMARFQRLATWSWVPEKSFYEQQSPRDRILMIGSCLVAGGKRWAREHGRQMEWLAEQGVTPETAVRRFKEWKAEREALTSGASVTPIGPKRPPRKKRKKP